MWGNFTKLYLQMKSYPLMRENQVFFSPDNLCNPKWSVLNAYIYMQYLNELFYACVKDFKRSFIEMVVLGL